MLKDQQRSSQTVEKMSHYNKFSKTNFLFHFLGVGFLLLLFVTIRYFGIPIELSFFTNKVKYVITELKLGLCAIKLYKSKFFLILLPIYLTFLTLTSSTPFTASLQFP